MQSKTTTLSDAVGSIQPGAKIALGGNTLHRGPCAAVHEIVRQGIGGLDVIKTAGAYDIDLLAATGLAASVSAGFVGFETVFGMAPSYRRAVERGEVETKEHACYTVIAGLRAAVQGVPFMPIAGMFGSDLLGARDFRTVEDVLMAQAARRVIVTAERLVDGAAFEAAPETVAIPGFMVHAVVEVPRGAWPCSCAGEYDFDAEYLAEYIAASKDPEGVRRFVEERILTQALSAA